MKIPSEPRILDSLGKRSKAPLKYQAVYQLLLDSGLRLAEAVELVNNFTDARAEKTQPNQTGEREAREKPYVKLL